MKDDEEIISLEYATKLRRYKTADAWLAANPPQPLDIWVRDESGNLVKLDSQCDSTS